MELTELLPSERTPRSLYCDDCGMAMDLVFRTFSEHVSEIKIDISNLPMLECHKCRREYLTDGAVYSISEIHRQALERGAGRVDVTRKSRVVDYSYTSIPFFVDADDYYYIPGLYRPSDLGFLTPLFFNKIVLIKFANLPAYDVQFTSPTYGTIHTESSYLSFGINRHGKVIMWLGDVANLPEQEQYYLRSENVPSDHSLGSDFYDGQVECKFTDPPKEAIIVEKRSAFAEAFKQKYGAKLYQLDDELIIAINNLAPPLVDTERERKHMFDNLNRIFVESMNNSGLEKVIKSLSASSSGDGSLKRLQAVLETVDSNGIVSKALLPFYVIYDLRIAYAHLISDRRQKELISSAAERLALPADSPLADIYNALVDAMIKALDTLTAVVQLEVIGTSGEGGVSP